MTLFRPLHAVLLPIAATAIAGPVWAVFVYAPPPVSLAGTIPDARTLAKIEAMAETACRCRRSQRGGIGKDSCWDAFQKTVAPYEPAESVMACGATGTESICFNNSLDRFRPGYKEACLVIDTSQRGKCNDEERRTIAAIWPEWERFYDDPAQQARAEEADRLAHEAFERGDRLKAPAAATIGCGG